ncbi:GDSL esterase/lipase 5 [Mucuna pruriens]|uniref:GDSL esterase/lipase 5 n=1 Tax=Mucuna pruriens TaxID=157652 RepID=A0A371G0S0_MUCPR|nr:GDSL esterase/lipase 5 [Mucuna pruriens]
MKFTEANLMFFLLFFFIAFVSHTHGSKIDHRSTKHVPFFIFGDSFLDAGNNNYINTTTLDQANFWPYGETYFKFPTGRFSDGRLLSDFIAEYANLPLVAPFLQPGNSQYYGGVNFASGGAGALVETFEGSVIPFKTQARNFKKVTVSLRHKLGSSEAKLLLSSAVYMFSIGSNDYLSPFLTHSDVLNSYSHSAYVGMVVGNFTSIIKEIYKRGARKFVFMTLPPLGCLPGTRIIQSEGNGKCLQELSALASLHNRVLSVVLLQLEKQLKGFKFALYDFSADLTQMINHPFQYGLKEGKSACCGSGPLRGMYSCGGKRGEEQFELCDKPNEYLFWDSYHLTESAYKILADQRISNMASLRVFVMLGVFMCSFVLNIYHSHSQMSTIRPKKHRALFTIGDSLCDPGNNNYINTTTFYQANYPPYGETFFKYPSGRFSDGRVIPDLIAEYAELPLIPPYLHHGYHDHYIYGVNFASAGAGALAETNKGLVVDLKTQVLYFGQLSKLFRQKLGKVKAKKLLSTAVYLFSIGGNDYASPYYRNSYSTVRFPYSQQDFVDMQVYNEGARKFGFLNLAPLHCLPLLRRSLTETTIDACLEAQASQFARIHNNALRKTLEKLEKQLKGFKYSLFNFYDTQLNLIKYPKKYGFEVGNSACCGGGPFRGDFSCGGKRGIEEYELCNNPNEYQFFDSLHPTDSAAQHFAKLMWNGKRDVIDLKAQANYFTEVSKQFRKKLGDVEAKTLLSRAIYIFSIGGNDYGTPFLANSPSGVVLPYPQQKFVDYVIGNITATIKVSKRKMLLVVEVVPTEEIIVVEGKEGLKNELCSNVNHYVFFDSAHLTESAAEHISKLMWSGNKDVIDSYNLNELFHFF